MYKAFEAFYSFIRMIMFEEWMSRMKTGSFCRNVF